MNKKIISLLALSVLLALPVAAFAIAFLDPPTGNIDYSAEVRAKITQLFNTLIWPVVITIVIVMFIMAGFSFLTSQGEPTKLEIARKWLIWGIIGVIVILLSFSILTTVQNLIGVR